MLLFGVSTFAAIVALGCNVGDAPIWSGDGEDARREPKFVLTFFTDEIIQSITPPPVGPQPWEPRTGWPTIDFVLDEFDLVAISWADKELVFFVEDPDAVRGPLGVVTYASRYAIDYMGRRIVEGNIYHMTAAARPEDSPPLLYFSKEFLTDENFQENELVVRLEEYITNKDGTPIPAILAPEVPGLDSEIGEYLEQVVWQRAPQ